MIFPDWSSYFRCVYLESDQSNETSWLELTWTTSAERDAENPTVRFQFYIFFRSFRR